MDNCYNNIICVEYLNIFNNVSFCAKDRIKDDGRYRFFPIDYYYEFTEKFVCKN